MNKTLISEVKKKREFSGLPDELVWKFLEKNNLDVKETRADLRKFFGVFLTNRVLKGNDVEVLKNHISSKGRDYTGFYREIFQEANKIKTVVDLGCGVNGFSYGFFREFLGKVSYVGVEVVKQLVDKMNCFFERERYDNARAVWLDLFDLPTLLEVIRFTDSPRAILMLQVIDALENLEKDYSKKVLAELKNVMADEDILVISMPMKSISGRKKFEVQRTWLTTYLDENFKIKRKMDLGTERIIILKKS